MKLDRTFVDGLDDALGGGVPHGSIVLLAGAPGTMKSSLAYAVLHANARAGNRGLYVTFEQARSSLLDQMAGLGMDPVSTDERLSVLDLPLLRKRIKSTESGAWLDLFKLYANSVKAGFEYEFLVLDSLDALEILGKLQDLRRALFELYGWLRELGVTTFMISELPAATGATPEHTPHAKHKEDYLADGIVHIKMAARGSHGVQRQIRVVKMRGVRHSTDYHALIFDGGQFRVTRVLG